MDSYRPLPGTPVDELDTPCLLVELDAVEGNYRAVADAYRHTECKMRQHTKNVKSPPLARMQIQAGGTVNGVCCAKVSEAEVMVEGGIADVLIANQVAHREKIARMCALAKTADVKVGIDSGDNLHDISRIAESQGVRIGVLVEVDTQMGRAGVRSNEEAVALAKLAYNLRGVDFKGVMCHESLDEFKGHEDRFRVGREALQVCLDAKAAIEEQGIAVEVVSAAETFSFDIAPTMPGITEVEGGTYALGGTRYAYMEQFQVANKVLSTIISTPRPGVAIGDAGSLALSSMGADHVEGMPGVTVDRLLPDHVVLKTDGAAALTVGDKITLVPSYQDMLVNRWDQIIAVRDGVVEHVWDIPARGCTQ
jgi:D-serine deaminase-like pyridoxal phosphate-dependent protein